jgi:general secretion pathway protein D
MRTIWVQCAVSWLLLGTLAWGQAQPPYVPPGFGPVVTAPQPAPEQVKPAPAQPGQQPGTQQQPVGQPAPAAPPLTTPAVQSAQPVVSTGGLNLQNASLTEVVDILARQLKINYILDPRVKGGVILNTYGEVKQLDARSLLDMILRINGFGMVPVGEIYRIVPLADAARLPIRPRINAREKDIPDNDQIMLNLIFLKYATVEELSKLLEPFIGENAKTWAYPPANLLLVLDSNRSMRRTMELIGLFDSDTFAGQRVRLYEMKYSRPSDLSKELETVFKSISLNEKSSPIKFLPIDRINTLVVTAANPGAFDELEKWIKKLDVEVKITTGSVDNYVYRVKYGRAETLAMAIMMLYGGMMGFGGMMGMGGFGMGMPGMGYGGMGYGGMGYGGMGYGGMGYGGMGYGGMGYGGMGYGGMGYGGMGYGGMGYGGMGYGGSPAAAYQTTNTPIPYNTPPTVAGGSVAVPGVSQDSTGMYLGAVAGMQNPMMRIPRVVPNPMDNTLLIQGTAQEYQGILKLLRELDIPPRQVLIEAKIYEVSLTGALASGVSAFLRKTGTIGPGQPQDRSLLGGLVNGALLLTGGALVDESRELMYVISMQEAENKAKVVSAPSIIATDSIAASINVGTEVPTLTSQAVSGVNVGGNSTFAQNINNRNTGVTLGITARVNPSGIVTLMINQEVSSPIAPAAGGIQSPSFSKRSVQTQVTVQDGDTIAIGGIINETNSESSTGIPFLHRIPYVGAAFGAKSISRERTELVVFMTPRVIYDTNEIRDASDELISRLKRLTRMINQ